MTTVGCGSWMGAMLWLSNSVSTRSAIRSPLPAIGDPPIQAQAVENGTVALEGLGNVPRLMKIRRAKPAKSS